MGHFGVLKTHDVPEFMTYRRSRHLGACRVLAFCVCNAPQLPPPHLPPPAATMSSAVGSPAPPQAVSPGVEALETYRKKDTSKIIVRFKAVGNAPIMKQNFYKITASNRFQAVIQFLRKELGWKAGDPLFTYINLAFSPAPDDTVANLFKLFQTEGHLIVNYSSTAAWG
ncbi:ubiquitin-like autophagy protein Apg12-domain-containing protein [Auriculariales sp. MPI-PUGE-AT-0066]|nr:ubiquitin-like autophagy protein Apg12-domain-containing protein [Auriculariales sp. MPI-PUGE-AT-0066]